jgi:hypothetical protein
MYLINMTSSTAAIVLPSLPLRDLRFSSVLAIRVRVARIQTLLLFFACPSDPASAVARSASLELDN